MLPHSRKEMLECAAELKKVLLLTCLEGNCGSATTYMDVHHEGSFAVNCFFLLLFDRLLIMLVAHNSQGLLETVS